MYDVAMELEAVESVTVELMAMEAVKKQMNLKVQLSNERLKSKLKPIECRD